MAGVTIPQPGGVGPSSPLSSFGNPGSFTAGATTQAGDYDTIMNAYRNFLQNNTANPITAPPIAPQTAPYAQSADVTGSLAKLSDLSTTGGYDAAGIADIRARDIAPTRSIYANAQQNVERAKALGGGYSPNFNATQASMARDESSQIADINTAANAGIAQNVAANRIAAAPSYASAAAGANAAETQAGQFNAGQVNSVNTDNANRAFQAQLYGRQNTLGGIQGMTSLYGTTPALTKTFGDQVIQAGQLGQGQQQLDQNKQKNLYQFASGVGGA